MFRVESAYRSSTSPYWQGMTVYGPEGDVIGPAEFSTRQAASEWLLSLVLSGDLTNPGKYRFRVAEYAIVSSWEVGTE